MSRKIIKFSLFTVLTIILLVLYSNLTVERAGSTGVYSVNEPFSSDVAIVLGAKVLSNGSPSTVLADRLDTGIQLYKSGRVKKLLFTGDHGQTNYDEVNNMRRYAVSKGVPEKDIFMDHAGFSTYDSMYRARDIFLVNKAVILTQEFHLPRSLYIARVKAFLQLSINMKPKYLGPAIPISGDGRATKDTEI